MGDYITINIFSLIESAFEFFSNGINKMFELLLASPTSYPEVWEVVMKIFQSFLGVSFSIIMICTYIGLFSSVENIYQTSRPIMIVFVFMSTAIAGGLVAIAPDLLLIIVNFCQGILNNALGNNVITDYSYKVPMSIRNISTGLGTLPQILLWLICLIGALTIVVVTFIVMIMAYGRLFKMYIYISFGPLAIATFASRHTQRIGVSYVNTFIVTCLEGAIIIVAFMIFGAFTKNFEVTVDSASLALMEEQRQVLLEIGYPEDEIEKALMYAYSGDENSRILGRKIIEESTGRTWDWDVAGDPFKVVFSYVSQMSFLFLMLASFIKGSENEFRRMFGV